MASDITDSMVKVYSVYNSYDFYRPWQMKGQRQSVGSGCVVAGNLILTNAHVVADQTFLQVQLAGGASKHVAHLERVAHECDLALLRVEDPSFFEGTRPLNIGELPRIGDKVAVYGFPQGGSKLAITEGIVSRVENLTYVHSWAVLLCCQTDAPINPGSSGGPVMSDGMVVGVAFQAGEGQNVGYIVPPPVISHFLNGTSQGAYHGFPCLGLDFQNMENPGIRERYSLEEAEGGVLVTKVFPRSPAENVLRAGDVLLKIDRFPIANDGTVEFRPGERTSLEYSAQRRQIGEGVQVEFQRDGKSRQGEFTLTQPWNQSYLVPRMTYEVPPSYFIIGGVVFSPVTTNLLLEWESIEKAPREIAAYYFADPDSERRQVITVIQILPDEVNVGYDHFIYTVVDTVNGKKIGDMKELVQAFESCKDDFYSIVNEQGRSVVLDRREVGERNEHILKCYRIPADRSDDLMSEIPAAAPSRTPNKKKPKAKK